MKQIKRIILIVLVFIALAYTQKAGYFDGKSRTYSNLTRDPYVKPDKIKTTLIITYSPSMKEIYETESDEGDSAFNLLRTVTALKEIPLDTIKDKDDNIFVVGINGQENTESRIWEYTVNGNKATELPDHQILSEGDSIEFIYINN